MGALAVDGPALFCWLLVLVLSVLSVLLFAERHLEGGVTLLRRSGRGAPRHRGGARGLDQGPRAHRGLPADDVRGRRHADVPGGQRPADHVRGARGPLAAALPALWPGPSAPAAQPGSGDEVLPARCVQLRLLRLRHRAGLRVRRVDGLRRDRPGRRQPDRQRGPPARRHRADGGRPAVQGRCRAVPRLDARRLPGRADRRDRVHGGQHQGGCLRCAAPAVLRRLRCATATTGSR